MIVTELLLKAMEAAVTSLITNVPSQAEIDSLGDSSRTLVLRQIEENKLYAAILKSVVERECGE